MRSMNRLINVLAIFAMITFAQTAQAENLPEDLEEIARRADQRGALLGNPQGSNVVLMFFDYNCGYCRKSYPVLAQLVEDFPDLKVVLVENPILGENSQAASVQSLQLPPSAYTKVFSRIMSHGGRVDGARIAAEALLQDVVLPGSEDAATDVQIADELQTNRQSARDLGLRGVPGFYINGETIFGLDEARLIRQVCGYTVAGSCNAYQVLLDDAERASYRGTPGDVLAARTFVSKAVDDARRINTPASLNTVCWQGSLLNMAEEVLELCNELVDGQSDNASYRDSRGFARALTGNTAGAISDFKFFVEARTASGQTASDTVEARRTAIEALESNERLTNAELISLLE